MDNFRDVMDYLWNEGLIKENDPGGTINLFCPRCGTHPIEFDPESIIFLLDVRCSDDVCGWRTHLSPMRLMVLRALGNGE